MSKRKPLSIDKLHRRIIRAARMSPTAASKMMREFMAANCSWLTYVKLQALRADLHAMYERGLKSCAVHERVELRQMYENGLRSCTVYERALKLCDTPTAEAIARWEQQKNQRRSKRNPLSRRARRVLKSNRAAYEEFERDGLVVATGEVRLAPDGVVDKVYALTDVGKARELQAAREYREILERDGWDTSKTKIVADGPKRGDSIQ